MIIAMLLCLMAVVCAQNVTTGTTWTTASATTTTANADMAKCASLSGSSCAQCTEDWPQCGWCESTKTCTYAGAGMGPWFGPTNDVMKNLFPGEGMCADWQFDQCVMPGRFVVMIPAGVLALCFLCCIGICVCCACRSCKKKRARGGYSSINDVPLLRDEDE